jgi:UDP-GlcNAc:undecaprenyl-phosphate GlcNAc-1-phosphate transferase
MAWLADNTALLFGSAALAAALAGFLPFNLPPARIYLGDSGSSVLGLLLGAYTLQAAGPGGATVAIIVPVTILIVPIFDCTAAIVRRGLRGVGLAIPDRDHIHHRLLRQGWSDWQVLGRLGAVAALAGIAALPSMSLGGELIALLAACSLAGVFILGKRFGYEEVLLARDFILRNLNHRRAPRPSGDQESVLRRSVSLERPPTDDHAEEPWRRSA